MWEGLKGYIKAGSEEDAIVRRIDFKRLPHHVAVIMDGNGRWAEKRGLSRIEGHNAGSDSVREIVETAARTGVKVLTLYAFSKENWKRPPREVSRLWTLLKSFLKKEDKMLMENDLRLRVIGQKHEIPPNVVKELDRVEAATAANCGMTLVLALNYSGRSEIVEASRRLLADPHARPDLVNETTFAEYLFTAGIPDPDLLIRTSGELRLSNFLLWQIAYTELWITPVLWPDFRRKHLLQAIVDFQRRERRFGDVSSRESDPA